ncbi:aminoacyl-tRNA hydrolase [Pigmentibacter sp. JX0631]|uniref:aminoacyl-tRNA hydrolase n=1 Tax=Pigmentibacter sp. JX0631 TaxID=2976982 RepID=UPI002468A5B5|nr:aminoacyl-tRNA hydrolase [Pigmentibacter sp. JX0631]WGL58985.1 aminoacyl-tRNA hydrolase [Pigmentibacter sp. JX0631]
MFILVGLGNPGYQYEQTRHNIGFLLLDQIAAEAGVFVSQQKFASLTARTSWQGHDVFLMKPQEYMNLSGNSVQQALAFFKVPPQNLIVIFDDLDQSHGAVKTRFGGGHGGHNGIRSILERTGTDQFHRVKVGIGKPEHKSAVSNWVLSKFTADEFALLEKESFPTAKNRIADIMRQVTKKSSK